MFGLILMTLAMASADVIFDGACPAMQPVKDFDMSAFAGKWYQIEQIQLPTEGKGDCGKVSYTVDGDSLKFNYTRVLNGVEVYLLGVAKQADDASNTAKLVLDTKTKNLTQVEFLWILDTDYKNYYISYSCKYDENSNTHGLNLWVLSRSKSLEGEAKTAVETFLSRNFSNDDVSKYLVIESWENTCNFPTSRVSTTDGGY